LFQIKSYTISNGEKGVGRDLQGGVYGVFKALFRDSLRQNPEIH